MLRNSLMRLKICQRTNCRTSLAVGAANSARHTGRFAACSQYSRLKEGQLFLRQAKRGSAQLAHGLELEVPMPSNGVLDLGAGDGPVGQSVHKPRSAAAL